MRDNRGVDRRSFAQDFFFELMRDSQRVRAVYLAERERWIRTLEIAGREEVLFELEMLLRGIDRFFNLRNLFGDKQPPTDRDFREELKAARDAVHRATHLSRRLIVQKQEQALLFRSFVEGTLADDRARARLGAELREQRTPEESLFLLRSGLSAQQGIIDHLLRVEFTPQQVFVDVGRALQHELFVSRYFCPPAAMEFRAEYDRVSSVKLLEALRQTPDDKKRRAFALALLAAFRSLRSLRYVPPPPTPHSRRVLVILALVRSELVALIGYLESELARLRWRPARPRCRSAPRSSVSRPSSPSRSPIAGRSTRTAITSRPPPRTRSGPSPPRWTRASRGRRSSTPRKGAPSCPSGCDWTCASSARCAARRPSDSRSPARRSRWRSPSGASRWSSAMLATSSCATATASCSTGSSICWSRGAAALSRTRPSGSRSCARTAGDSRRSSTARWRT